MAEHASRNGNKPLGMGAVGLKKHSGSSLFQRVGLRVSSGNGAVTATQIGSGNIICMIFRSLTLESAHLSAFRQA